MKECKICKKEITSTIGYIMYNDSTYEHIPCFLKDQDAIRKEIQAEIEEAKKEIL